MHRFHDGDVYFPVEPGTLLTRLQTIGFAHVTLIVDDRLKFIARKAVPAEAEADAEAAAPAEAPVPVLVERTP